MHRRWVGDTIYLSGQVSHDEQGNIVGLGDMEMQVRQAYANVEKVLAQLLGLLACSQPISPAGVPASAEQLRSVSAATGRGEQRRRDNVRFL